MSVALLKLIFFGYFDVKCVRTWLLPNMSHEIVNECNFLMRNCVVRRMSNSIDDAKFFAILADETRDVQIESHIRWVIDQLDIHEDFFIGLVHIEQSDAKSSNRATKYVIIRFSRPLSHCRGQGLRGLLKRVEADEASAITVHGFARCLNVFARSTRQCSIIIDSLAIVQHDISKLISNSPNHVLVFNLM